MAKTDYLLPLQFASKDGLEEWARRVVRTVNGVAQGKTNNTGQFTLATSTASTVISLPSGQLGTDTVVAFFPTTANAATEFGAGTIYVSNKDVANAQFTVTHANNANNDRTFDYFLVGG